MKLQELIKPAGVMDKEPYQNVIDIDPCPYIPRVSPYNNFYGTFLYVLKVSKTFVFFLIT